MGAKVAMSETRIPVEEHVKNLLKFLSMIGPSSNELTQMLFLLPQKAITLMKIYPELMEKEDILIEILGLSYTNRGFVEPSKYDVLVAHHLAGLFHTFFELLSHPEKRKNLLELANLREEEFKEFDPLRAWFEISIKFLAESNKNALRILEAAITKLAGKKPEEYIEWKEIKNVISEVKDFEAHMETLKLFHLLRWKSSNYVYARECPLLLDAYSDLRNKLKELLR